MDPESLETRTGHHARRSGSAPRLHGWYGLPHPPELLGPYREGHPLGDHLRLPGAGFLTGLPSIARQLDAERIDPERVPNEKQVWAIANAGGELEGEWFKVAVLLGTFGAMRIGELVALRRRAIRCVVHDGLWLTIDSQIRRYPRRYSDDGNTATDFAPPKGRPTGSAGRRRCYVPKRVALEILEYVDSRLPDQLLFLNSYGRPMSTATFREAWNRVIKTEPAGPRLCRHHPTCHASCGDVDVATARSGPEADPELGGMALTHRDARYLRCPLAGGRRRLSRPTRGSAVAVRATIRNESAATTARTRKVERPTSRRDGAVYGGPHG